MIVFKLNLCNPIMWGVYFWGYDYRQRKVLSQNKSSESSSDDESSQCMK